MTFGSTETKSNEGQVPLTSPHLPALFDRVKEQDVPVPQTCQPQIHFSVVFVTSVSIFLTLVRSVFLHGLSLPFF